MRWTIGESRLGTGRYLLLTLLLLVPLGNANATGSIGRQAANFCAPAATTPDVGMCSACHMTPNQSVNDLNAAGMQAQAGNYAFFCPMTTPPTTPPITPPTGGMGMGMSGTGGSMGMGVGGSMDDDDDDDEHENDDDD